MLKNSQLKVLKMYKIWLKMYVYPVKNEAYTFNIYMFIALEIDIITLILSQHYDSNNSRQLLNNFKALSILSIIRHL